MKKYDELNTILLIDDDEATNYYNESIILSSEVEVETVIVYNAQDGLDYLTGKGKFEGRDSSEHPGIIFLDINMPGMSGWDFLEEYNKLKEFQKAEIIIAMLTTSLNPTDQERAEKLEDIKQFMHKPLTKEQVQTLIEQNFKEVK